MTDKLTQKGLFERLVRLETKLDMMDGENKRTDIKFTWFASFVILIEVVNLVFNYFIYLRQ